jgi:hypothetical protein
MNMLCMNNNAMFPCVREEDTAEQVGVHCTATVPLKVNIMRTLASVNLLSVIPTDYDKMVHVLINTNQTT